MLKELSKLTPGAVNDLYAAGEDEAEREYIPPAGVEPLATWWIQKTPGTTYWRCSIPAKHLPGQALAFRYSDAKVDESGEAILPRLKGVGVWQFVGNASRALFMAHSQHYLGTKALMECDDNYLVPPPTGKLRGASDWHYRLDRSPQDRYSSQAHRKIIRWVDALILGTDELAERYARATSRPIFVCPNSIDLDDWPEIVKQDAPRSIGYAGSASHRYDLSLVERGLSWAAERTRVYRLGVDTVAWGFPHEQIPWTDDLMQYRRNLQVLDVGLCPLKRGDWADCKSDIKAMEYLLAGAVPIVQGDSPCYRDWWDIVPSAVTEKDWLKQVKWAANAPREELDEVWQRGMNFLLERKLIGQHIGSWRAAINDRL